MMSPLMLTATLLVMQLPASGVTPGGALPGGELPADETASGAIEGVVSTHEGTDTRPLPYAIIQASIPGKQRTVLADSLGRYRVEAVPQGTVRLWVSHVAYRSARVSVAVPDGETVFLDIDLERSPIAIEPITVTTDQFVRPRAPTFMDAPIPHVDVIALGVSPGLGEAGLGEAAAALPGNDPADPSDVLFMRGSTTDLKLVLLDGAPVYTPFHLGGLLSSFDAYSLGAAALHTGGAPARYDGGALLHPGPADSSAAARQASRAGEPRPHQREYRSRRTDRGRREFRGLQPKLARLRSVGPGWRAHAIRISGRSWTNRCALG